MRDRLVVLAFLLSGLCAIGCGGGYREPATPTVEEEETATPAPENGAPEDTPDHEDDLDDDDDVKPKGDPTDDIGDPPEDKRDDQSLTPTYRAKKSATRRS
jgi:hypothetical protein